MTAYGLRTVPPGSVKPPPPPAPPPKRFPSPVAERARVLAWVRQTFLQLYRRHLTPAQAETALYQGIESGEEPLP